MVAELGHVVFEEVPGRLDGDLAAAGEDLGREADVGLGAVIWRALQKLSTARRLCWATAVPIWPIDAPITPAGMWSKAFWPQGREAQSMAFLSAPGIERLYSG